jgi:hypothetical protein
MSLMTKKIALIGSAPSSVRLAPYADPTWELWACSPGAYPYVSPTRPQAWFEIHRWEPPWGPTGEKPWFTKDYIAFLASLKCPVYMIEPVPEIPTSVAYPKDAMIEKFGPWFFTSSLSWMFALAIHSGATEIGLWGVDMSAQEEWIGQRSGCHYFIDLARKMGITVTLPPESDLLRPPPLYGFAEADPMHVKLLSRENELKARIAECEATIQHKHSELMFLKGALDNNTYHQKTWVADQTALRLAYQNPAPVQPVVDERTEAILEARSKGKTWQDALVAGDAKVRSRRKPNGNGAHVEV